MIVAVKKPRKETKPSPPSMRAEGSAAVGTSLSERIARKAYELWEQRGRQDNNALQDWLDAEAIVMDQAHESRE